MKKILTIIVSYNFTPWLDKCIQSLLNSTHHTDILVVDNNSHDDTVHQLAQKYPSVQVIVNSTNLGFGCANNLGLKIALEHQYDFAFLVNQDAWIAPDCLRKLISINKPEFGIISPTHMDGTENKLDSGFSRYIQNAKGTDSYGIVPFINAAFWLIPLTVLKKIGGFSSIFYHYGEDKDYANRVLFHKFKIVFVKDAFAYHDRQNRVFQIESYIKSEFVYYLTEYCNINYNFFTAFTKAIGGSLKKASPSFRKHDKNVTSAYYIKIAWQLICLTSQVVKTRSMNKKTFQEITITL